MQKTNTCTVQVRSVMIIKSGTVTGYQKYYDSLRHGDEHLILFLSRDPCRRLFVFGPFANPVSHNALDLLWILHGCFGVHKR